MELILRAWSEPQPFGWQGRHFQYRTVSVWPRPSTLPHPPTYALGTSREAGDFAARNRIGLGVSYGPFDVMGKATGHYREQCTRHGWAPGPDQIIFRANIILAKTDVAAERTLAEYPARPAFSLADGVADALLELDARNVAGEARPASVNRPLPINFVGGPDTVIGQIRQCRKLTGAGVIDLGFQTPGSADPGTLLDALEMFGKQVLPHIADL
jgi:alkanesulfonate monooxygenase SsuD/methylene tetrahydromethanopterin reductase-like flavin-dependent oxidoreductase (luciferase family)